MGKKNKTVKRILKYSDYRKIFFDMTDEQVRTFFDCIRTHEERIIAVLGEEQYHLLGTYETVIENMQERIQSTFSRIETPTLPVSITHYVRIPSHFSTPSINHNITSVKYEDIFRVYKDDTKHSIQKVGSVSNWSGVILDEEVRKNIIPGNIARIAVNDGSQNTKVIYFRILHKVDEHRYLAEIENHYLSSFEDIVIVIDVRGISEIPVDWEGNDNLIPFNVDNGLGYGVTGLGALVHEEELFPLTYQNLTFS